MIERLVLKDFKSHEASDIAFHSGLNIFLGEVGAGKTSIFEAVSFVLFGRYAGSTTQRGLIRRGAEVAEVSLTFSTRSGRYRIDRTIYPEKPQQARLYLFADGEWQLAVEGATAVAKSVEDLLSVDTATFLAAIYASQGEIKEMLETQPGRRRERLDRLLGLDMYESIWTKLGDAQKIVLMEQTQAQERASGVDVLERQLTELKTSIQEGIREVEDLRRTLTTVDEKLESTEHQLTDFDDRRQRVNLVRTQVDSKVAEIAKASQSVSTLRERRQKAEESASVFEENKEFVEQEKQLEAEQRRVATALQQKRSLRLILQRDEAALKQSRDQRVWLATQLQTLKALDAEMKALDATRGLLPALKLEQTRLEGHLDGVKGQLIKASSEVERLRKQVDRVTRLGECPTCLQTVPEEHKERIQRETGDVVTKLIAEYASLEETLEKVQRHRDEVHKQVVHAEQVDRRYAVTATRVQMLLGRREELAKVDARIDEITADITEIQQQIEAIEESEDDLTAITQQLEAVAPKAARARAAEKLAAAQREIEALLFEEDRNCEVLTTQLRALEASAKTLEEAYDEKTHHDLEARVRALRERRAKAAEGIARLERTVHEETQQTRDVKKTLVERRKAQAQVQELKVEDYVIDLLRQSLRTVVQPVMRKTSVSRVSDAFQSFYQELSNDSIDYAAIDEEGNVDIIRNGEPSPVNSLSGGETTCAALALRLAICSSLTRNQLLLLDEPTIHLDEVYRAKLREFLGGHVFEQLIVVTHDNTFDALPAKIFRVEKQRGRSVVFPLQGGV